MRKLSRIFIICVGVSACLGGCSCLRTTGSAIKTAGKVGWNTAKVTGKVAYTAGKVTYKTGQVASKGIRTAVYMAKGKQIIPLQKEGNSLYAQVKMNSRTRAKMLVDTGAATTQISRSLARDLKINLNKGDPVMVSIANGQIISGREVVIRDMRLNGVRVKNVKAIVLDQEIGKNRDGLLGMTFFNHFVFQIDADKPELVLQQKAK